MTRRSCVSAPAESVFSSHPHSKGGFCPRKLSSIVGRRGSPRFEDSARNDVAGEFGGIDLGQGKNVGGPTFQVSLEAVSSVTGERE
jgi:hypothetical protein